MREFIQLVEPFFVFSTESVTHGPRFIPQSVFYTQSVMLSPPFIPESVFYIQSVFYTESVVRSPYSAVRVLYILVPRGRAPFGQHQESRPLAGSNDIPVLNGFVNTID